MAKPIIEIKGISFRYREDTDWTIKDLSLSIEEGAWVAVVGRNGSGKSTLAKLMNGLLLPQIGSIHIDGFSTNDSAALWEVRRRVGLVFQNPDHQLVGATVQDDIAFGMENYGVPHHEMIHRLKEVAKKVGITDFLLKEPNRLSGGQKQRVAIAGILAVRPSIIIFDEATSMLDPEGREDILSLTRELNQEDITVISITHNLEEALVADWIYVMDHGSVIYAGSPSHVFQQADELRRIGLDVPFSIQLRDRLILEGVRVSDRVMTEEELVEELWTLYSGG